MNGKESKPSINLLNSKVEVREFYNDFSKKEKNNQDFSDINLNVNNGKISQKYSNIISYSNTENIQNRGERNNQNKKNLRDLNNNNEIFSEDKFIQTPSNFYNFSDIEKLQNKSFTPNNRRKIKKENKFKEYIRYNNYVNNKITPRIISGIKPIHFSQSFYNKFKSIKNEKLSRNYLCPIINYNKPKTNEMENNFKNNNILREYSNNIREYSNNIREYSNNIRKEKKKKHHNLFTIENIYFQKSSPNIIYKINNVDEPYHMKNKNIKLSLIQKKYSIKEIKYPFNESVRKKYKIINENNDHLLEEIFKRQTLSNFNNKYNLKYKTNSNIKKESIKNLFSLLKKYKYSDEDKKTAFNKYNSMKKIKKTFNI